MHQHSSAAPGQLSRLMSDVGPESSAVLGASKSSSSVALEANKLKRGGFMVSPVQQPVTRRIWREACLPIGLLQVLTSCNFCRCLLSAWLAWFLQNKACASHSTAASLSFMPQDGGGVTKDGGLPPAPTLFVSGERELVSELERIIDALNKGAAVDWEKR